MKIDVDGKLKQIHVMIMSLTPMSQILEQIRTRMMKMVRIMAQLWLATIRVAMAQMCQAPTIRRPMTRIKTFNVNRLMRLGCVLVVQKTILFVSNSAEQAWIFTCPIISLMTDL